MLRTWMFQPKERITFTKILTELEGIDLNTMSKSKPKSLNDAMKAKQAKSVDTPSSASNPRVTIDTDGYVSEKDARVSKDDKLVEIQDGYVADVIEKPVAKPQPQTETAKKAPQTKPNALYSDQPTNGSQKLQQTPAQAQAPVQAQAPTLPKQPFIDNGYVQDPIPLAPGGSRPQLRAAGGPVDNGYIDTNTILPGFYAATNKPQLRAGGGGPAMSPAANTNSIDVLQALANAGLHQYVPIFLQYGITALDMNSAAQITDYYLQQLGIYDPNHRYMIIAAIASGIQGLLILCFHYALIGSSSDVCATAAGTATIPACRRCAQSQAWGPHTEPATRPGVLAPCAVRSRAKQCCTGTSPADTETSCRGQCCSRKR
jgi:hypothetical protein